jgi:hypothetical protein
MLVSILTVIGILPAFLGAPIVFSACFAFPFWFFSGWRIFSVRRYLNFATAGEITDAFSSIGPEENETIWDSKVAATYRKVAINTWLIQTVIFLVAPLYFNFTDGGRLWLPILIMVFGAITMASVKAGLWIFRAAVVVVAVAFLFLAIYSLFPQVAVWSGLNKQSERSLSAETAKKIKELSRIRKEQKDDINNALLDTAKNWQLAHPGQELPPEFQEVIEAAEKGLTPSQMRKAKKREEEVNVGKPESKPRNESSTEKEDDSSMTPENSKAVFIDGNWTVHCVPGKEVSVVVPKGEYDVFKRAHYRHAKVAVMFNGVEEEVMVEKKRISLTKEVSLVRFQSEEEFVKVRMTPAPRG